MYQGTTPAVLCNVKNFDLTGAKVFVSFKNKNDVLTKTSPAVTVAYDAEEGYTSVITSLTQEETLAMKPGSTLVQIRFIFANEQAYATNKQPLEVENVIWPEVIRFGGA